MDNNKISIIGTNNLIANKLICKGYQIEQFGRFTNPSIDFTSKNLDELIIKFLEYNTSKKFLIFSGFLQTKSIMNQTYNEKIKSNLINASGPVLISEYILERIEDAEIIIMGSESGFKGSYDLSYALAKSSLRMYVKQRCVKKNQKILLISPSTVNDLGMTERREDIKRLEKYKNQHPKKRFINCQELVDLIDYLFKATTYLTNTEKELYGGKFSMNKFN